MLTISTCFWRANQKTAPASRGYEPFWVDRLARAWRRNLTLPHRFVAFVDRPYEFEEDIEQVQLSEAEPTWHAMIEPFSLGCPNIICGLDTVVLGNCDPLADYCLTADRIAIPLSPGKPYGCNAVVLCPGGLRSIYDTWDGGDDMEHVRRQSHEFIDARFPGWVQSYKCHVRPNGVGEARLIYMHGRPKMDELGHLDWVRAHWR